MNVDDEADVDVIREYRICSECIQEKFLSAEIEQGGTHDPCSYCDSSKKTISIGELADQTKYMLEQHFYQTSVDSSPFEDERGGDPIVDVIATAAGMDELPASHVQQVLENDNYDHEM
jgi:hypothetical protein